MSRVIVASRYVWSHYPGLRAGRLYAGKPDLTTHPTAETHLADGPYAAETLCGLPRTRFPHEFPETTALGTGAQPCTTCMPGAS